MYVFKICESALESTKRRFPIDDIVRHFRGVGDEYRPPINLVHTLLLMECSKFPDGDEYDFFKALRQDIEENHAGILCTLYHGTEFGRLVDRGWDTSDCDDDDYDDQFKIQKWVDFVTDELCDTEHMLHHLAHNYLKYSQANTNKSLLGVGIVPNKPGKPDENVAYKVVFVEPESTKITSPAVDSSTNQDPSLATKNTSIFMSWK